MNVAVIGATGKAGRKIASEAFHRGHNVTAIVRDPSKLDSNKYGILKRDILEITTEDILPFDVVIDAYAAPRGQEQQHLTVMSHLAKIFEKAPKVRLLIVGGASSLYTTPEMTEQLYTGMPPEAALPINQAKTLDIIKESSANWTFFSPALKFDAAGGRTGSYLLGGDYIIKNAAGESFISYEDYDIAMVDEAENAAFVRRRFTAVAEREPVCETEPAGRMRYLVKPATGIEGKVYHLVMDDSSEFVLRFTSDDTLLIAERGEPYQTYGCKCLHIDERAWFVSFMRVDGVCVTLLLDEEQSLATIIYASVTPKVPGLVRHETVFGAIKQAGSPLPFIRHGYTSELVGSKIAWRYSPVVTLTHCYIDESHMRNSLKNMAPLPQDATQEQKAEVESRAERWGRLFFEEPASYIRINPHLYVVTMIEANRHRIDPTQGGGDMVFAINTRRMRYYGRGFSTGSGVPRMTLMSARGDWIDLPDEVETCQSPYMV